MAKPKFIPAGTRFGRLTVVRPAPRPEDRSRRGRYWECICDCGGRKVVFAHDLINGDTRSCGCLVNSTVIARNTTHGGSHLPEYRVWAQMIERCHKPGRNGYEQYGARGITVCPRWRESFAAFIADMGPRPSPQHSIDRIDNSGHYCPENCRWATRSQQSRNRNGKVHPIEFRGQTKLIVEWAEETGIPITALSSRLNRGWSLERAFTEPVHREKRHG